MHYTLAHKLTLKIWGHALAHKLTLKLQGQHLAHKLTLELWGHTLAHQLTLKLQGQHLAHKLTLKLQVRKGTGLFLAKPALVSPYEKAYWYWPIWDKSYIGTNRI